MGIVGQHRQATGSNASTNVAFMTFLFLKEIAKCQEGIDNASPFRNDYKLSGEGKRRAALLMAAEERYPGPGFGLRSVRRMEYDFRVELVSCFRLVFCGMNGPGALWQTGTFLGHRCETGSLAARLVCEMHHAVMLAVSTAAGWESCLGIRGEQRRRQQPAEH